ncbi:MAG TPA: hypothetical protein VGV92_08315 [Gammaproteobacteria bacterium]|nr:hypothetical protein [Gammaproteobacteria bacterium]
MSEESKTTEPATQITNYLNIVPVEYPVDPNAKPPSAQARKVMQDIREANAIEARLSTEGFSFENAGDCCCSFWSRYRQRQENNLDNDNAELSINSSKVRT